MSSYWKYEFEIERVTEQDVEPIVEIIQAEGYDLNDDSPIHDDGVVLLRGEDTLFGARGSRVRHNHLLEALVKYRPSLKLTSRWKCIDDEWDDVIED